MFFTTKTNYVTKHNRKNVFLNILFASFQNIKFEIVFILKNLKNTSINVKLKINASKKTTTTICIRCKKQKFRYINFEFEFK